MPTPNEITAAKFAGQPADKTLVDVDPREETVRLIRGKYRDSLPPTELAALEDAGPSRLAPTVAALRDECLALTTENNRLHALLTEARNEIAEGMGTIARQARVIASYANDLTTERRKTEAAKENAGGGMVLPEIHRLAVQDYRQAWEDLQVERRRCASLAERLRQYEVDCESPSTHAPTQGDGVDLGGQGRESDDPIGGMRIVTLSVCTFAIVVIVGVALIVRGCAP